MIGGLAKRKRLLFISERQEIWAKSIFWKKGKQRKITKKDKKIEK